MVLLIISIFLMDSLLRASSATGSALGLPRRTHGRQAAQNQCRLPQDTEAETHTQAPGTHGGSWPVGEEPPLPSPEPALPVLLNDAVRFNEAKRANESTSVSDAADLWAHVCQPTALHQLANVFTRNIPIHVTHRGARVTFRKGGAYI